MTAPYCSLGCDVIDCATLVSTYRAQVWFWRAEPIFPEGVAYNRRDDDGMKQFPADAYDCLVENQRTSIAPIHTWADAIPASADREQLIPHNRYVTPPLLAKNIPGTPFDDYATHP